MSVRVRRSSATPHDPDPDSESVFSRAFGSLLTFDPSQFRGSSEIAEEDRLTCLPHHWNDELLEAVKHNLADKVRALLAEGNWEPLGPYVPVAAQWGHLVILMELFTAKADPNACLWGKPAVTLAAENGHHDCVRLILESRGSPDTLDLDGETAHARADARGHRAIVDELGAVGARQFSLRGLLKKRDVASVHDWVLDGRDAMEQTRRSALAEEVSRESDNKEVMLLLAAQAGKAAEVKHLVEVQAVDPDTRAQDGKSALELAVLEGHMAVVQFLSLFSDHSTAKAMIAQMVGNAKMKAANQGTSSSRSASKAKKSGKKR